VVLEACLLCIGAVMFFDAVVALDAVNIFDASLSSTVMRLLVIYWWCCSIRHVFVNNGLCVSLTREFHKPLLYDYEYIRRTLIYMYYWF
jgi:hypothetical protein